MKLEYSAKEAAIFGYSEATLKNGDKKRYTSKTDDEFDGMKTIMLWKDSVIVYRGKDIDIVSIDNTNRVKNKREQAQNIEIEYNKVLNNIGNIRENCHPTNSVDNKNQYK